MNAAQSHVDDTCCRYLKFSGRRIEASRREKRALLSITSRTCMPDAFDPPQFFAWGLETSGSFLRIVRQCRKLSETNKTLDVSPISISRTVFSIDLMSHMAPEEGTTEASNDVAAAASEERHEKDESNRNRDRQGDDTATVEIDLSQSEEKVKVIENNQIENGFGKEIKAPVEVIISKRESKLEVSSANGKRKSSSKSDGAQQQVEKSGRIRHIIALLALSSILLANMNRQAYNQALVRMIKHKPKDIATTSRPETSLHGEYGSTATTVFDFDDVTEASANENPHDVESVATSEDADDHDDDEGFDWTSAQISLLQAGFSYGYTFFMIPGGRMSEIYGAKWVIFLSSFGSALCSLFTPFLAHTSYTMLVGSRIFMGLCQTGISPALYALYSRWLPPEESSVYLPMIKVGVMFGFMCGSLLNGFLPWQPMFYLLGLIGFAWSALWVFFASSTPSEHKFVSEAERTYIKHCLDLHSLKASSKEREMKEKRQQGEETAKQRSKSAPWLRILKNPIVLAFTFTKFTVKLSTDTQTMQIPMYLRNVFQISDQLNGILNGANFAIQAIFTGIVAYVAKEMVVREQFGLRKTGIRRLFQGINCFGMSLAYLLISFNMGSLELVCCAVILLSITSMFGAGGEAVLPIDLTTEYSASIMAIANSAANLSGIILPPVVSFFLANQLTSSDNWNQVWRFVSTVMACGGIMFTCIVKAKIQGFNEGKKVKEVEPKEVSAGSWTVVEMDANRETISHL